MAEPFQTLRGVVTALGTPLDANEDLHEEGMRLQIRMQIKAGVNGLLVTGSMGAMQLLKEETFRKAVAVAADEVGRKVVLIAGCADTSTERTLARIKWCEQFPLDGIALVPPFFYKFTQEELLSYFSELADKSAVPIYLYDNPVWTKHALEFPLIRALAQHPNIAGLKASGDFLTLRLCAEEFRESKEFSVLSGQTTFFDLALHAGARGIVEGLFAMAPELGVQIWDGFQKQDFEAARKAQQRLTQLALAVREYSVFAAFTVAMNTRGVPGNFAIRPFSQVTPELERKVRTLMVDLALR